MFLEAFGIQFVNEAFQSAFEGEVTQLDIPVIMLRTIAQECA